jgi:hypothetical protein
MPNDSFNFYQGTGYGTGIGHYTNAIDFFTGAYFPVDLALGKSVGFYWPASDKEIHHSVRISGATVRDNKDYALISVNLRGGMLPLVTQSAFLSVKISSGDWKRADKDVFYIPVAISGDQVRANIDKPLLYCRLSSGNLPRGDKDTAFYTVSISGAPQRSDSDRCYVACSFSGGFTTPDKDYASVSIIVSEFGYADGPMHEEDYENNETLTVFVIDKIIYNDAS